MIIVGINGSPNKKGNTQYLIDLGLQQVSSMGAKTEMIQVSDVLKGFNVPFCTACSSPCQGVCWKNTGFENILDIIREADGLIIGSPVYFGTISGQLKAFWDKLRCLRGEKKLLNTVGGAVAVGASRFGGQEGTIRAIQEMMLVQGMTIVGGGQFEHDCGHYGVSSQRPAEEDSFAKERAIIMAKRIYEVCLETKNLRKI